MVNRTLLVAVALLAVACGKRGDPRPPVPVIPQATSDLVVTQRADKVILSWSYPSLTTAGRSLPAVRNISVYRYLEELPVTALSEDRAPVVPGTIEPMEPQATVLFSRVPAVTETQFAKLSTRIESIENANLASATAGARLIFVDEPPFRAEDGRPVRLTYAVVTEGESARSDFSNLALIVPLDVGIPPSGVKAAAGAEGVVLAWNEPQVAVSGADAPVVIGYNVYRSTPGDELIEFESPVNNVPVQGTTYTDAPAYGEHDYRVTAVAQEGPPLVQSDPSAPVRVTFRDIVPPPPPATVTPLIEPGAIRLIWDPVQAPDLAGYRVYRSEGAGHVNIRDVGTIPLTPEPITTTGFVDRNVNLGIAFRYAVTSVDRTGNESERVWTAWVVAPKSP